MVELDRDVHLQRGRVIGTRLELDGYLLVDASERGSEKIIRTTLERAMSYVSDVHGNKGNLGSQQLSVTHHKTSEGETMYVTGVVGESNVDGRDLITYSVAKALVTPRPQIYSGSPNFPVFSLTTRLEIPHAMMALGVLKTLGNYLSLESLNGRGSGERGILVRDASGEVLLDGWKAFDMFMPEDSDRTYRPNPWSRNND